MVRPLVAATHPSVQRYPIQQRFLVGITALSLAVAAAFGVSQPITSVVAASPSSLVSVAMQHGPGKQNGTHAGGQVASVSGTSLTVTTPDGTSQIIQTTASTAFNLDGSAATLGAIAAKQFIRAEGTTDSAGSFTATAVHASTTPPQGRPGPGGHRR